MTCDFWAENGKRKMRASAKAIKSVTFDYCNRARRPRANCVLSVSIRTPCVPSTRYKVKFPAVVRDAGWNPARVPLKIPLALGVKAPEMAKFAGPPAVSANPATVLVWPLTSAAIEPVVAAG